MSEPADQVRTPPPRTVFVTGATGFVGAHLVRRLASEGHTVRALVRKTSDRRPIADLPLTYVEGDLGNRDALREGCAGADWIIHVAGRIKAPNREQFFRANHEGTVNLMQVAAEAAPGCRRFVYVSSLAAGGSVHNGRPRSEDDPDCPINDYGKSKLAGEQAAMSYAERIPVVSVRPPAVYGPGDPETLAFFKTVRWHLKPTFAGKPSRISMVYVGDLIDGILCALDSPQAPGEVFYIAEPRLYSIMELEDAIQDALGNFAIRLNIPRWAVLTLAHISEATGRIFRFEPRLDRTRAQNFLERDWACATDKAERLLGFQAQVPFAEGAVRTVTWYRKHKWL